MRLPLATDLKTRSSDLTKDAREKNAFAEVRDKQSAARKRPGSLDLGLIEAGAAQILDCWNGLLSVVGDSLSSLLVYLVTNYAWTSTTIPNANWADCWYGNGKFVAVGYSDTKTAASADGIDWQEGTVTSRTWLAGIYVPWLGKHVAVSISGYLIQSTDGITWDETRQFSAGEPAAIARTDSLTCIPANGTDVAYISTNGSAWTDVTLPTSANRACAVGNSSFVLVPDILSASVHKSSDGIAWNTYTIPETGWWYSAVWNGSVFCLTSINTQKVAISADGQTWLVYATPVIFYKLVALGSLLLGLSGEIGGYNSVYKSSDNGVTWTLDSTLPSTGSDVGWARFAVSSSVAVVMAPKVLSDIAQCVYGVNNSAPAVSVTTTDNLAAVTANLAIFASSNGAARSTQQMLLKSSEQAWIYTP